MSGPPCARGRAIALGLALCSVALGSAAATASDSVLVFNEIHYHPSEGDAGVEWVELHSLMGVDVDISGWSLTGGIEYTFADGTVVEGGSYLVVASARDAIEPLEGQIFAPFSGRLNNGGERLRLVNNSGRVMDEVDYRDSGDWPVAPDGSGATLAKVDQRSADSSASNWAGSVQVGGTPGAENFPGGVTAGHGCVRFNEIAAADGPAFFVELVNLGAEAATLADLVITSPDGEGRLWNIAADLLQPGEIVAFTADDLGFRPADGDRLFLLGFDLEHVCDARVVTGRNRGRSAEHGGRWLFPSAPTPGEPNAFEFQSDVVINEIHYRPHGDVDGGVFSVPALDFIELHNRSATDPADLSRWSFSDGVGFEFPGGTMIAPGGFLVLVEDAAAFTAVYPDVPVAGEFNGALNDGGELLELRDAANNPADTVRYHDGGAWPGNADGGGSSLELRDPRADNALPGAWGASDETAQSPWRDYSYSGRATNGLNDPTQYNELVLGLLDEGEVLLDDIRVVEGGRNLTQNGTFGGSILNPGGSTDGWRIIGNHFGEVAPDPDQALNNVLHLVATGSTEHMHNHAETTLKSGGTFHTISSSATYQISFRAKWLTGSNQLNSRLYFNRVARTTLLERPRDTGTPGAPNSVRVDNLGPTFDGLGHAPAVPAADQAVTVSVAASDPDGLAAVTLHYAVDGGAFNVVAMAEAGGGRYAGTVPGQASGTRTVQFFVSGEDAAGATSTVPAAGVDSRALIPFDNGEAASLGRINNFRIVMTEADTDQLHLTTNVMSNHRIGSTVIYNEEEIYYDVGNRLKGSQRGRDRTDRAGFNLQFPADRPFLGRHGTVAVDRSGAGNQFSQKEILVKHAVQRAGGIPGMYDDLIRVIAPRSAHTGSAMLLKARYDSEFLDSQFPNGSDGTMFEYELIYFPTTTTGGDPEGLKRPNPDSVRGVNLEDLGDDKEAYRWHFQIKNNRDADDYSGIIEVLKVLGMPSGATFRARTEELLDIDQWLRAYAVQTLFGIGDNYTSGSQHNLILYVGADGKTLLFPWDMDFTFSSGATSALVRAGDINQLLEDPANARAFYGHVDDLLRTVFNQNYMRPWAEHYSTFLPTENLTGFVNYIGTRNSYAAGQVTAQVPRTSFAITTNGGADFTVGTPTVTLEGRGWVNVREIVHLETGQALDVTWTGRDTWELEIPLRAGENRITLQARDFQGGTGGILNPVGRDTVVVTNTGAEGATKGNLVLSQFMYHPPLPDEAERAAGYVNEGDEDLFEYLELLNIGAGPVDLAGLTFDRGISSALPGFPGIAVLPPGGRGLLVRNEQAFRTRYPAVPASAIIGVFQDGTGLSDGGENLTLLDAGGSAIFDFRYNDRAPWPRSADGRGSALVLVDPGSDPDHDDPGNWRPSNGFGGEPGAEPPPSFAEWRGDHFDPAERADAGVSGQRADPDGDGLPNLLEYALGSDPREFDEPATRPLLELERPPGQAQAPRLALRFTRPRTRGDLTYAVEATSDLAAGFDPAAALDLGDPVDNGDGTETLTVLDTEPAGAGPERRFLRLRIQTVEGLRQ